MNEETTISNNNKSTVTIVIVNYNTKEMTIRAINSALKNIKSATFDIIVVDNDSSDNSYVELSETFKEIPNIEIIDNKENVGFGRACNVGIKKAKGEYIYLLNPDAHLKNDTVEYFLDFIEKNKDKKIGALGSFLLNDDGTEQYSHGSFSVFSFDIIARFRQIFFYNFIPNSFKKKIKDSLTKKSTQKRKFPINVEYMLGANVFIPKYVLEETGAFDPDYFVYTEEVDLQYRMMKHGYERILIEGPIVLHESAGSFEEAQASNTQRIMLLAGRVTFVRKHYTRIIYKIYKSLITLSILLEIPLDLITRKYTVKENLKLLRLYRKEQSLEKK